MVAISQESSSSRYVCQAVVAAALARFGGDVRLEASDVPKDLRVAKCLQTWWVPDPQDSGFLDSLDGLEMVGQLVFRYWWQIVL